MAPNTPPQDAGLLEPPRASYIERTPESVSDSSRGSLALHSAGNASPLLSQHEKRFSEAFPSPGPEHPNPGSSRKRAIVTRPIFWIIASVAFIAVTAAVILPVYFFVIKPQSNQSTPSTGGNGSVVTTSDGTTFTYVNNFGGFCEFACFFRIFIRPLRVLCSVVVITSLNAATVLLYVVSGAAAPGSGDQYLSLPLDKRTSHFILDLFTYNHYQRIYQ
jgi:magnesium-transporting ATPase (P-type)